MSVEGHSGLGPPPDAARVHVYLAPGQLYASDAPCEVTTILGSCVGVLLIDGARGIGGVSHYLLPYEGRAATPSPRFGDTAIKQLIARMFALGSRRDDLVAKVFGGASMLTPARGGATTLGAKNVELARRLLDAESIPVVAEDVGGHAGRKLIFLTDCGQVWVKKL